MAPGDGHEVVGVLRVAAGIQRGLAAGREAQPEHAHTFHAAHIPHAHARATLLAALQQAVRIEAGADVRPQAARRRSLASTRHTVVERATDYARCGYGCSGRHGGASLDAGADECVAFAAQRVRRDPAQIGHHIAADCAHARLCTRRHIPHAQRVVSCPGHQEAAAGCRVHEQSRDGQRVPSERLHLLER